jgi:hypothetical protein
MKNSKLCEYRLKDAQSITNRKKTDRCGPPIIYCALRWAHTASCSPVTVQPGIRVRLEESVPDLFKLTTRHPFPPCIQLSPNSHRSLVKYYILHPFVKYCHWFPSPWGCDWFPSAATYPRRRLFELCSTILLIQNYYIFYYDLFYH